MPTERTPSSVSRHYAPIARSAARLLASRPVSQKKASPRHGLVFFLGIALGLFLALGLTLRLVRTPVKIGSFDLTSVFAPKNSAPRVSGVPSAPILPRIAGAPLPEPSAVRDEFSAAADAATRTAAFAPRTPVNGSPSPATATKAAAQSTTNVVVETQYVLTGELRETDQPPVAIAIILNRRGYSPSVNGEIRYYRTASNGKTTLFASNAFVGTYAQVDTTFHAHTIELRETHFQIGSPDTPVGRTFTINLPSSTDKATELSGTWSFTGLRSGTLSLKAGTAL